MLNTIQSSVSSSFGTNKQTNSTIHNVIETSQSNNQPISQSNLNSQIITNQNQVHSNALAVSLASSIQSIAEMFLGFAENTGISMTYMLDSTVEFIGAALMSADSFFRQSHININIHIDKLMATVQGAIGALLATELLMKFTGSKGIIKNIKWIDKASKSSETFVEKAAKSINISRDNLMSIFKVGLGTSSTLIAIKKFQLAQQMVDPQQKDGFLRSMWIDILCSLETLLLFIPQGNIFESIVEKIYLAFSSFKLLGDSVKKLTDR